MRQHKDMKWKWGKICTRSGVFGDWIILIFLTVRTSRSLASDTFNNFAVKASSRRGQIGLKHSDLTSMFSQEFRWKKDGGQPSGFLMSSPAPDCCSTNWMFPKCRTLATVLKIESWIAPEKPKMDMASYLRWMVKWWVVWKERPTWTKTDPQSCVAQTFVELHRAHAVLVEIVVIIRLPQWIGVWSGMLIDSLITHPKKNENK